MQRRARQAELRRQRACVAKLRKLSQWCGRRTRGCRACWRAAVPRRAPRRCVSCVSTRARVPLPPPRRPAACEQTHETHSGACMRICSVWRARQKEKSNVEAEMRLVLKAMDVQKAAASRNMAQLSKIYDDWSSNL